MSDEVTGTGTLFAYRIAQWRVIAIFPRSRPPSIFLRDRAIRLVLDNAQNGGKIALLLLVPLPRGVPFRSFRSITSEFLRRAFRGERDGSVITIVVQRLVYRSSISLRSDLIERRDQAGRPVYTGQFLAKKREDLLYLLPITSSSITITCVRSRAEPNAVLVSKFVSHGLACAEYGGRVRR